VEDSSRLRHPVEHLGVGLGRSLGVSCLTALAVLVVLLEFYDVVVAVLLFVVLL
jgi:hypothetical protein